MYMEGGGELHGELTVVTSILPGTNLIALQLICPRGQISCRADKLVAEREKGALQRG